MFGRDRRQDGPTHYQMREKVFAIGEDYWITADDERVYKVNGKALRLRDTFIIENREGGELVKIQSRPVHIRDTMEIEDLRTGRSAKVKKALITPLRERFSIDFDGAPDWKAKGHILDHEYEIESDDGKVAEVSKKWFRVRDTYGIEVAPGYDPALVLAVAVCLDEMSHD